MFKKINFYQLVITTAAVLFASVLIVYGWSAPAGGPPGNDVPAPINTGDYLQVKDGPLFVSNKSNSSNFGLSVLSGNLIVGSTTVVKEKAGNGDTFSIVNARDVWLRDANGGTGGWASQTGSINCTCIGSNLSLNSGTSPCWTSYSGGNSKYPHCGQICTPAGWRDMAPCGSYY